MASKPHQIEDLSALKALALIKPSICSPAVGKEFLLLAGTAKPGLQAMKCGMNIYVSPCCKIEAMEFVQEYPLFPGVSESLTRYVLELNKSILALSVSPVVKRTEDTITGLQAPVYTENLPAAAIPAGLPPAASPM
jgi:hypothetical protein